MTWLAVIYGSLVGISLGITGGGGSIFAVPLLVYGLAVEPVKAVGVSLVAVWAAAAVGCMGRWIAGQVEIRTGLFFAVSGMITAPLGSWLGRRLDAKLLMLLFTGLMFIVAWNLWRRSYKKPVECVAGGANGPTSTCQRDGRGELILTSPCAMLLAATGLATGLLSGLFGVGGGFIIVPALVLFSGMGIHRAVATSLFVITLISFAGLASHLWAAHIVINQTVALFVLGSIGGMVIGTRVRGKLPEAVTARVFAVMVCGVAVFVIVKTLLAAKAGG